MTWQDDFREFLGAEEVSPPEEISHSILAKIESDLRPSLSRVLGKVAVVHLLVGTLTLAFCPQFGVSLGAKEALFGFLMRYGSEVCTAACGAFFLGMSALVAGLVLRPEEARLLQRHRIFPWVSLGLFSLLVFHLIGESVIDRQDLVWLIGSVLGAWGFSQLSGYFRALFGVRWAL